MLLLDFLARGGRSVRIFSATSCSSLLFFRFFFRFWRSIGGGVGVVALLPTRPYRGTSVVRFAFDGWSIILGHIHRRIRGHGQNWKIINKDLMDTDGGDIQRSGVGYHQREGKREKGKRGMEREWGGNADKTSVL